MAAPDSIADFYAGANVLVTGATGFLGKVLLEKLLRSCEGVRNIYVLVKPKKGFSCEQRLQQLRDNQIFDKIRENSPDRLDKIRGVWGDVDQPCLGLGVEHRNLILETVHVVFHSAATVNFMREFKSTIVTNTFGTEKLAELCKEMKQLKCFVYVSTAYSNAGRNIIEEQVYEPPYLLSTLRNYVAKMPDEAINLLEDHRNPYTVSKAFSEKLVSQYASCYPIAIVRPSIISCSWKEPYPGWVDSYAGATGVIMFSYLGILRDFFISGRDTADVIPVDVVVNTIIAAAWYSAINRENTANVYNCTSGQVNNITWAEFMAVALRTARKYPTNRALGYPNAHTVKSRLWFKVLFFFNQFLPALVYDIVLKFIGHRFRLTQSSNLAKKHLYMTEFVTHRTIHFCTANFRKLTEAVKQSKDGEAFPMDMSSGSGFTWESYLKGYILGIRQYILKDDPASMTKARVKANRMYWIHVIVRMTVIAAVCAIAFKLVYR